MTDRRLVLLLGLLTAAVLALSPSRADAAPVGGAEVLTVDVTDHPTVALTVEVPPSAAGGTWTASVVEEGRRIPAQVRSVSGGDIEVALVVDTSGSMAGAPLEAAKQAARAFVQGLPATTPVAVVGFGERPYLVSPMTLDRNALDGTIAGLRSGGDTALYDALHVAADQFSTSNVARSIVLISDGADSASTTTLPSVTDRMVGEGIRLFGVRLLTDETNDIVLADLATATKGEVRQADDVTAVGASLDAVAGFAVAQLRVTYRSVRHGQTDGTILLDDGAETRAAEFAVELPPAPLVLRRPAAQEAPAPSSDLLVVGGASIFVALLLALRRVLARPRRSLLAANRGQVRRAKVERTKERLGAAFERTLERRGAQEAFGARLEQAGIALRPGEYLVTASVAATLACGIGTLLAGLPLGVVFAGVVAAAAHLYLGLKVSQRRSALERQLPDLLQQVTNSLRAGYGIMQSLDNAARESDAPMSDELRRVVTEVQLGRELTESLEGMSRRVAGQDFAWVVQAIEINREVGGELAGVLDAVNATIRARAHLRRQIKTLSAQGRLSARILLAMPFVMAGLLTLLNPGYLTPLFTEPAGPFLLVIGSVMMTVGWLWLRRIVRLQY